MSFVEKSLKLVADVDKTILIYGFRGWEYLIFCYILSRANQKKFYANDDWHIPEPYNGNLKSVLKIYCNLGPTNRPLEKNLVRAKETGIFKHAEFSMISFNLGGILVDNGGDQGHDYNQDYLENCPWEIAQNNQVIMCKPTTFKSFVFPIWYYENFYNYEVELPDGLALLKRCINYFLPKCAAPFDDQIDYNIDHLHWLMEEPEQMEYFVTRLLGDINRTEYDETISHIKTTFIDPYDQWYETFDKYHQYQEIVDFYNQCTIINKKD